MARTCTVDEPKDGGFSRTSVTVMSSASTPSTSRPKSDNAAHENDERSEITCAERNLQQYLRSFLEEPGDGASRDDTRVATHAAPPRGGATGASFGRQQCCHSSQSLYCKECLRLLVPDHALPVPLLRRKALHCYSGRSASEEQYSERPLTLPFDLQIVLDDRRGSATGLHAVALLDGTRGTETKGVGSSGQGDRDGCRMDSGDHGIIQTEASSDSVTLIDLANGGETPEYPPDDATTFLLYPSPDSIPLDSVAGRVQTLVVLDCKWTKNRRFFRNNPRLSTLQQVHLSAPPRESYYWRWHNAGPGMISTIEAIYYAAFEVSQQKWPCWHASERSTHTNHDDCEIDQENLVHLLWLFGHQRAATFNQEDGTPAPCSVEGKEHQRSLRKQKGTWRQLRHKDDELRLMERNRVKEEKKESTR